MIDGNLAAMEAHLASQEAQTARCEVLYAGLRDAIYDRVPYSGDEMRELSDAFRRLSYSDAMNLMDNLDGRLNAMRDD